MRSFSNDITTAIHNKNGIKLSVYADFYKTYQFINTLDDHAPSVPEVQTKGIVKTNPTGESYHYDAETDCIYTVYSNSDGHIMALIEGNSTPIMLMDGTAVMCPAWSRPTLAGNKLFYYYDGYARIYDINYSILNTGSGSCLSSGVMFSAENGTFYGIDDTHAVMFYIDHGGIQVKYILNSAGTWVTSTSPRLLSQTQILNSITTEADPVYSDLRKLFYCGATLVGSTLYVYFSLDGMVYGITKKDGTVWSDFYISIPSDLTEAYINQVFSIDNRIFIVGQFASTEDTTGEVMNFSFWSDDGITFSIDQFTVFSNIGYRLNLLVCRDKIYTVNMNRIGYIDPMYMYYGTDAKKYSITTGIDFSGDVGKSCKISVVNEDRAILSSDCVERGCVCIVKAKYDVGDYFTIGTYIVSNVKEDPMSKKISIELVTVDVWRLSFLTYPFYLEIQSKQSVCDLMKDFTNLYLSNDNLGIPETFAHNFPLDETLAVNGRIPFYKAAGTYKDIVPDYLISDRLLSIASEPIVSKFPIEFKIYGWSRIGGNGYFPEEYDSYDPSELNDDFQPILIVKGPEVGSVERTIVVPLGNATTTTYPPQYWKEGNSRKDTGSYPVVFSIPDDVGINIGDKIVRVGVRASSDYDSLFYIERVEMDITVHHQPTTLLTWKIDEDYITPVMAMTRKGIPGLLVSSSPYSAKNFIQTARLTITGSYSYAGLFGCLTDSLNYICARATRTKLEFISVRNGAVTVLATKTMSVPETFYMMMQLKNGIIKVFISSTSDFNIADITYVWNSTNTDGPICLNDDLSHLGIYGFIDPPKFRITSFDPSNCIGIGVLPGFQEDFAEFPSSGTISIDDGIYTYGSKTSFMQPRGLYQVRNSEQWNYRNSLGGSYAGNTIDISMFEWKSEDFIEQYKDMLLSSVNGYAVKIKQTDWRAWIITNGRLVWLYNRSRHFHDNKLPVVDTIDRAAITCGLLDIGTVTESEYSLGAGVYCFLHSSDRIECNYYIASDENKDATVRDMINIIARMSGAAPTFPGDKNSSAIIFTGTEVQL